MRFLIDERLTTALLKGANIGHDALHIALIGKAGWRGWNVIEHAIAGDNRLVTNNAADFRKLYALRELHPGLIVLLPSGDRETQKLLFAAPLKRLSIVGEPINKVVEVSVDGQDIIVNIYALPPTRDW
jgi:predicted nuclease of predicted toxin-antitoxin system